MSLPTPDYGGPPIASSGLPLAPQIPYSPLISEEPKNSALQPRPTTSRCIVGFVGAARNPERTVVTVLVVGGRVRSTTSTSENWDYAAGHPTDSDGG